MIIYEAKAIARQTLICVISYNTNVLQKTIQKKIRRLIPEKTSLENLYLKCQENIVDCLTLH